MEINEFFQTANNLMSELIQTDAKLTETPDMNFCLLETDSGNIYGGISSVRIMNGRILPSCAEYSAIMAMIPTGETHITQIVTMSFSSRSVIPPCQDCLYLLFRVDKENKNTNIFVSKSEFVNAQGMLLSTTIEQADPTAAAQAMNMEDTIHLPFADPAQANAPAADAAPAAAEAPAANDDFINGFVPDDDNPFYEAPNPDALAQAKTLAGTPTQQPTAAPQTPPQPLTNGIPVQQGMPQQGMPQQGMPQQMYGQPNGQMMYGMPPQGQMNPYGQPMNGYPQQNMMFRPSQQQQMQSAYYPPNMQNPYGMPQQQMMTGYYGTQAQYTSGQMPVQPVMSQQFVSQQFRPANNSVQLGQSLTSRQLGADNEQSVFKQRLTDFLKIDGENQAAEPSDEDKMEMLRQAREKKKMAKLDSDYKKRQKK